MTSIWYACGAKTVVENDLRAKLSSLVEELTNAMSRHVVNRGAYRHMHASIDIILVYVRYRMY